MSCFECEEMELARVRDQKPSQVLPVPNEVMKGLPNGRSPGNLTRRRLLQGGMAGLATVYGTRLLGFEEIWESAVAEAAGNTRTLVMLYLPGGNDGLNALVPTAAADYAWYQQSRPTIFRDIPGVSTAGHVGSVAVPTMGGPSFAFAKPLVSGNANNGGTTGGFDTLYGDGSGTGNSKLALMPAVDVQTNFSLSHFDNVDTWFGGGIGATSTGWLGRWIDKYGSPTNPLQGVSIDSSLSKAIRTQVNPVCAIPSLSSLGFTTANDGGTGSPGGVPGPVDQQMSGLSGVPAGNAALDRVRKTYAVTNAVAAQAGGLNVPASSFYPDTLGSSLSGKLRLAATLVDADVGTRVITIHWGGFDTHGGQVLSQDSQLKELSRALAGFQADLEARGKDNNVSTMVFSEFGRRMTENGSQGTDHGVGGLMMMAGTPVRGGIAATWPGCTQSDLTTGSTADNLQVATDYRSVYAAVLEQWLGVNTDASEILGTNPASLQRGDSQSPPPGGFAGSLFR